MELQNTVKEALNALYHHPDDAVRNKPIDAATRIPAHNRCLMADNLLHDTTSNQETLIFCSQTLRSKVQSDFEELPSEAFCPLWVSLTTLLKSFHKGPPNVRTQISLAVAALAVHAPVEDWGNGSMVNWIQNEMNHHTEYIPSFWELLKVLPEIFGSDPSCSDYLKTLIESLFNHTTFMLAKFEDFTSQLDIVDDCFLLSSREASNSTLTFLSDVCNLAKSDIGKPCVPVRGNVIIPRGNIITRILVAAPTGALPSSRCLTHTLFALTQAYGAKAIEWAKAGVSLIPPNAVTETERSQILQALSDAATGNGLMIPIEELSEVCRRNRSVREIVQGALKPLELNMISVQ